MKKDKKLFSTRTKITTSILLFTILILSLLFTFFYFNTKKLSRDDLKSRLLNMVSIASLQVNGQEHSLLKTPADEQTDGYKNIVKTLKNIQKSSTGIYYIYTMRKIEDGNIIFVVDSDDSDPNNISQIGEVYNDASQFLKDNFSKINTPTVENNLYTDKWGTWLSGYAPLYDNSGHMDGLLAMDINALDIVSRERNILLLYIFIFIICLIFSIILGIFLSKNLAKSIISLTSILKDKDNKEINIEEKSGDEIDELGNAIKNKMNESDVLQKQKDKNILEKNQTLEKMNKLMIGRELEMIKLKKDLSDYKKNENN